MWKRTSVSNRKESCPNKLPNQLSQALDVQRQSLIHEATAEMMRRDTRKEEVLPIEK